MSILNEEVEDLIKKKVHLDILRTALEWDRYHLYQTKMQRVYDRLLDHVMEGITEELRNIKERLKLYQAKIIQEEQRKKDRLVIYRHQGYIFEKQYFNPLIKIECEKLLEKYLNL